MRLASTSNRTRIGVTMVEILVVIVIIGILSALAVPRFNRYSGESQLDGDANTFYLDLVWARTESIKRGGKVRVVFSTTTVDGTSRVKLTAYSVHPTTGALTELRSSTAGPTVALGLPTGVSAPTASQIPAVANLGTVANGYQAISSAAAEASVTTTCRNPGATPKWDDGIQICGTSIGDAETGAVYFHTTRSDARAYAILFDRAKSLAFVHLRYMGGAWEKL